MSARRFTVDVGNSSVSVAAATGSGPVLCDAAEHPALLRASDAEIAVISVRRSRLQAWLASLDEATRRRVRLLGAPPADLAPPELLASAGADRLAGALALRPGPGILVDGGTAVTVDVVDAGGRYLGGFIAPGPAAASDGLARAAVELPVVTPHPVPIRIATQTEAAMAAGLWGLVVAGVDGLVDAARAILQEGRGVRVIATGGWGAEWARHSRQLDIVTDPLFVHRGIARWAGWA